MASSVNKSMLFKIPYHVQGSACPPKFTTSKPPRTLGSETLPSNAECPSLEESVVLTSGEGSAVKYRSNGSIHCLVQRQTSVVYGIATEYLFFNRIMPD